MKIGVISDSHLGKRMFLNKNNEDGINLYESVGYNNFIKATEILSNRKDLDYIVICGDVFDKPNPTSLSISKAIKGYNNLVNNDSGIHAENIITIGGNHDFSYYNYNHGVHPFQSIEEITKTKMVYNPTIYKKEADDCVLIFMPYGSLHIGDYKNNIEKMFRITKEAKRYGKKVYIFGHGYLESGQNEKEYEFPQRLIKGKINEIPNKLIFGHIHNSSISNFVVYVGNLINDIKNDEQVSIKILDTDSDDVEIIELENIPIAVKIESDDINETLDEIIEDKKYKNAIVIIRPKNNLALYRADGDKGTFWDQEKFLLAYKKTMYLNIDISESVDFIEQEIEDGINDFWEYTKDNRPEWLEEFKQILKGET